MNGMPLKILVISLLALISLSGCQRATVQFEKMQNATPNPPPFTPNETKNILTTHEMNLKSTAFAENNVLPAKYTCDGVGINPPLKISGVPANAKSLALIVDDPDAPSGDFVHWVVFNISPSTAEIAENSIPAGAVEGTNGTGNPGFFGPCPPSGTHRYMFNLYALDTNLNLTSSANKADLLKAMEGHILDSFTLTGLYQRTK